MSAGINIEAWLLSVHADQCRSGCSQCACRSGNERSFHTILSAAPLLLLFILASLERQTPGGCFQSQTRNGLSGSPADRPGPGPGDWTSGMRPQHERDGGPLGGPLLPIPGADPGGEARGDQPGRRLSLGHKKVAASLLQCGDRLSYPGVTGWSNNGSAQ